MQTPRTSEGMVVMDAAFGQLVIEIRTLARCRELFDREAQRTLAGELSRAALRLDPRAGIVRRLVRSGRQDHDGAPLYRLVASW
jgi:hypothetical protein